MNVANYLISVDCHGEGLAYDSLNNFDLPRRWVKAERPAFALLSSPPEIAELIYFWLGPCEKQT